MYTAYSKLRQMVTPVTAFLPEVVYLLEQIHKVLGTRDAATDWEIDF